MRVEAVTVLWEIKEVLRLYHLGWVLNSQMHEKFGLPLREVSLLMDGAYRGLDLDTQKPQCLPRFLLALMCREDVVAGTSGTRCIPLFWQLDLRTELLCRQNSRQMAVEG